MSDNSDLESDDNTTADTKVNSKETSGTKAMEWPTESTNQMILNVMSQIQPGEAIPFNLKEIDWSKVAWGEYDSEQCETKWKELLSKVRHYRTMFEIATDMLAHLDKTKSNAKVIKWNKQIDKKEEPRTKQKKKKDEMPSDFPRKPPSSAYSCFSQVKMKELGNSLSGSELLVEVGRQWGKLSAEEKQKYQDKWEKDKESYLDKLMTYSSDHPEDETIKTLIAKEETSKTRRRNRSKSKKTVTPGKELKIEQPIYDEFINKAETVAIDSMMNGYKADHIIATDESADSDSETLVKSAETNKVVPSTSQASPTKSPHKKHKKEVHLNQSLSSTMDSGVDTNALESPVKAGKKRPNADEDTGTSSETPKKKKKHKKKKITGEQLYIEEKRDGYKLEHPDLEDEEVNNKLRRKYAKLSEKKMKKYELLAVEYRN